MKMISLGMLIFFLCLTKTTKAQYQFTLSELKKLCSQNSTYFSTTVKKKGYSLEKGVSTNEYLEYSCDIPNIGNVKDIVLWTKLTKSEIRVEFYSTNEKYFENLKNIELTKAKGWKLNKKINHDPIAPWFPPETQFYVNGKYTLVLGKKIKTAINKHWVQYEYTEYYLMISFDGK